MLDRGIVDGGYNLADDNGQDCALVAKTDILNIDPQLGPLANNGGPTQTMALSPTSPVIDVIPLSSGDCPTTDQRGVSVPDSGESLCDIGAYEYTDNAARTPILAWHQPTAIMYGTALSNTQLDATAFDGQGHPIAGSFAYSPKAGKLLHAGLSRPLKATFTPTDTTHYVSGSTVSRHIDVNQLG